MGQPAQVQQSTPRIGSRIRRVSGIDGLRGVAVAAVVIYHFFGDVFPGGYLGVDVFFVLSGFLITSLLVREKVANGTVCLKQFWIRRARRILPAALTVLAIVTVLSAIIGGDAGVGLTAQFLGTLVFANNWVQIAGSHSYFADTGVQVFAHYWSLAVEEQFYLLWPPLFAAITGGLVGGRALRGAALRTRLTAAAVLATILGAGSFALMVALYNPEADPTRVYYGTDTHSFGLLVGVVLAIVMTSDSSDATDSWPQRRNPLRIPVVAALLGTLAAAGLVALFFTLPDTSPVTYRGGLLAGSILTAIVLANVVMETGPVSYLMRVRPLRWLGERSFSLYLWHWPVIVLLRELLFGYSWGRKPWLLGVLALAISVPLSHWSYARVETPIRRKGYRGAIRGWIREAVSPGPQSRRIAVGYAVVTIFATGSIAAFALSPNQTTLERDLAEISAGSGNDAPEKAQSVQEVKEVPAMPTGDQITAIGDSVMLASAPALEERYPGIYIDAEVSRAMLSIGPTIDQLEATDSLDPFVVLGFGTNSAIEPEVIDEVMDKLGPDRIVVVTLPYGDRYWIPISQQTIIDAAERHPNLYVADWCHAAQSDPLALRQDLIHPTEEGAVLYVDAVTAAFEQWTLQDEDAKVIPEVCS